MSSIFFVLATSTRHVLVYASLPPRPQGGLPRVRVTMYSVPRLSDGEETKQRARRHSACPACQLVPRCMDHWIDLRSGGAPACSSLKLPEAQILGFRPPSSIWICTNSPPGQLRGSEGQNHYGNLSPTPFATPVAATASLIPPTELTGPVPPALPAHLLK